MTATARPGPAGPYGYQQITSLSASTALTIPGTGSTSIGASVALSDVNHARIQAESQDVRWRDDGTAPTATIGMVLKAGDTLDYYGDLNRIRFIETTTSAKLNVSYYTLANFV